MTPEAIVLSLVEMAARVIPGIIAELSSSTSDAEAIASLRARLEERRPASERLRELAEAQRQALRGKDDGPYW